SHSLLVSRSSYGGGKLKKRRRRGSIPIVAAIKKLAKTPLECCLVLQSGYLVYVHMEILNHAFERVEKGKDMIRPSCLHGGRYMDSRNIFFFDCTLEVIPYDRTHARGGSL
ncbi:MAG TPA: hypothetical protein V6D20_25210, partial [Candidatus Obscuribacterales bacterium]